MGRRKQFISKKESLRFNVVHRSQRDPRLADPEASDFVLQEVSGSGGPQSADLRQLASDIAADESALHVMDEHDRKMDAPDNAHFVRFADAAERDSAAAATSGGKKSLAARDAHGKPWMYSRRDFDVGYLGLPEDDGYDYSQHLRETGGGAYYSKDGDVRGGKAPGGVLLPEEDMREYEAAEKAAELIREAKRQAAKAKAKGDFVPAEARATAESELTPYKEFVSSQPGLYEGVDLEVAAMLDGELEIAPGDELEDDFVTLAMMDQLPEDQAAADGEDGYDEYDSDDDGAHAGSGRGSDDDDDDDDDYDGYMTQRGYYKDNYDGRGPGSERTERESLASTMSRRTQSVRVIDERFEESLKAYDAEDAIGELDPDGEDVQGHLDTEQIDGLLDEFLDGVKSSRTEAIQKLEPGDRKAVLCAASAGPEISEAELSRRAEEEIRDISKPREREQWDCETVISTYSNLENHPRLIEVIRPQRAIRLERGLPVDYLPARDARGGGGKGGKGGDAGGGGSDGDNGDGDNDGDDDGEDGDDDSEDGGVLIPMRVKGETAEEKRLRKLAVKEAKREARVRKKDLKTQFKKEEMRQTKQRKNEVSVRPL
jgi:protein LTV1